MAEDSHNFKYTSSDFIKQIEWTANADSKLDTLLQSRWAVAKGNDYFLYDLDQLESRVLTGQYGFVSQLNMGRANLRRKPQEMMSLSQPFDKQKFNFTKVKSREILMVLHNEDKRCKGKKEREDKDVVLLNVSPIEHCSVLLVPSINSQLPQILTQEALEVAIEMTILSARRSLLVGYNSLCASASVNHLHFHAYYLEHKLRLQSEPTKELCGPCHVMLSWPVPGFVFQLVEGDVMTLARNVYKVTEYLHNREIAHNVCLTRGSRLGDDIDFTHNTLRAFIWPRRSVYGVKPVDAFNVAFSELAGHLPIMNETQFDKFTEESAVDALQQAKIPSEKFQSLQKDVSELFIE